MKCLIWVVLLITCVASGPARRSVPSEEDAIPKYEIELDPASDIKYGNLKVCVHINETVELRCMADAEHFDLQTLAFSGPKNNALHKMKKSMGGARLSLTIDHFKKATNRGQYECSAKTKKGTFTSRLFLVEYSELVVAERCEMMCFNGGTCLKDTTGADRCMCAIGWSGKNCGDPDVADHVVQGLPNKWFSLIVFLLAITIGSIIVVPLLVHKICAKKRTIAEQTSQLEKHSIEISNTKKEIERQKSLIEGQSETMKSCHTLMRQKKVSIPDDLLKRMSVSMQLSVPEGDPKTENSNHLLNGKAKPQYNGSLKKNSDELVPLTKFVV
ncbi:hypothetical protein QR680_003071 [Steinernema hermaphroditum]|uniref:EGF-like domain-containing protein n=1 Tax=Steinernema hermaphroditum TaxID=289476 RepID=A0AA39H5B2_9BILA|nr:hypothetical protein QR680_003071 [Steinernema hermaphroditum]